MPRALTRAQQNARDAKVDVTLLDADIATVDPSEIGGQYTLVLDGGCLHGLEAEQRRPAIDRVTQAAEPGATLLMFAFAPGRPGPLPRGIDPAEVSTLFPLWELAFARPATEVVLKGPLRNADPMWYQLVRR